MPVVLVESHGQLFGFCSQLCARRWRDNLPALEDKECTTPFGCWLCGGDVTSEPFSRGEARMKTYGDAKFINCSGVTSDGIAGHSYRDFCGTCAPFWERVPLCPEHKYKLTETGYCRACKKHYALVDLACCPSVDVHITCHNGCFDLVSENGLCASCNAHKEFAR